MAVSKRIVLHFPKRVTDRPLIYHLVKDYDLEFNILKASVNPDQEGLLVIELTGMREEYDRGIKFLIDAGVQIQSLSQDVTRNEERCTNCGNCLTLCPSHCFEVTDASRKVQFHTEKCVACGICIKACPPRAMEVHF